jgi:hypothetical protein
MPFVLRSSSYGYLITINGRAMPFITTTPGVASTQTTTSDTCERNATIVGTPGNDNIVGTSGPDIISALGGESTCGLDLFKA